MITHKFEGNPLKTIIIDEIPRTIQDGKFG